MNLPQIIGVTGNKYNGKDTFADYLVLHYGYTKIAIADPIKEICKIMFNFNDEQLYGNLKEEIDPLWNIKPRNAFQFIGTDLIRNQISQLIPNITDNFWIYVIKNKILKENKKFIISDIRYENEVKMIKELNGVIFRIIKPDIINNDLHSSEINIQNLNIDYEIYNDSDLENFYDKIDKLFSAIK